MPRRYGPPDVATREKQIPYAVTLERDGSVAAEGNEPLAFEPDWTPEHLLLAAVARCTVGALRIHAARHSIEVTGTAHASGTIGKRDDGSWGFLEVACRADVELLPLPDEETQLELLAKAEHGCFIGGSLRVEPVYHWTVNGREVER
jgi:organic hydroperoxide reductase OsmC/OhrA